MRPVLFEKCGNEGVLDDFDVGDFQHSDDIRVVRTVQTSGTEDINRLATHTDHSGIMGRSILRILRHDPGKQDRIHG